MDWQIDHRIRAWGTNSFPSSHPCTYICGLALTQKASNENERHAIQPPPKGKATGPATVPLGNVSCGWMAVGTGTAWNTRDKARVVKHSRALETTTFTVSSASLGPTRLTGWLAGCLLVWRNVLAMEKVECSLWWHGQEGVTRKVIPLLSKVSRIRGLLWKCCSRLLMSLSQEEGTRGHVYIYGWVNDEWVIDGDHQVVKFWGSRNYLEEN